jgi:large subunit ribosomal protein L15
MTLLTLKANKGARHRKKRLGRGNASGTGTYAGRGIKGQKSRTGSSAKPGFEGGQTPIYRKMPKLKGFKNINRIAFQPVNVGQLNVFEDGAEIEITQLYEKNLISHKGRPVKILGDGELTRKLTIKADKISSGAKNKIEKAKAIELISEEKEKTEPKQQKKTSEKATAEEASPEDKPHK